MNLQFDTPPFLHIGFCSYNLSYFSLAHLLDLPAYRHSPDLAATGAIIARTSSLAVLASAIQAVLGVEFF
jgi:hypothetical protein